MPAELMLVNPRKRSRKRRKMTAKQAMYFGGGRRKRHKRRSVALAVNPRHRRRSRRVVRLARNPRRRSSGFKRVGFTPKSFIKDTLVPAGIGAIGALGVDVTMGYLNPYLPTTLQTGILNSMTRIGGAIGVGYVAGMAMGKKFGEEVMAGAVTVTLYDIVKSYVTTNFPTLTMAGLNGMGWISPGMQVGNGMGVYVGSDNAYRGVSGMGGMGVYVGGDGGADDYVYSN